MVAAIVAKIAFARKRCAAGAPARQKYPDAAPGDHPGAASGP
jgi:hypothetical protein